MVYAKPPFGGPRQVLDYLGRYTHRVAIANNRILDVSNGQVRFQWKDHRGKDRQKSRDMTLAADEFIPRFLIHTLPPGLQRIRYFGILTSRFRKEKLARCWSLLSDPGAALLPHPSHLQELSGVLATQPLRRCPKCQTVPACLWPQCPPDS